MCNVEKNQPIYFKEWNYFYVTKFNNLRFFYKKNKTSVHPSWEREWLVVGCCFVIYIFAWREENKWFYFYLKKKKRGDKGKGSRGRRCVWMLVSHPVASWPVGAPPPLLQRPSLAQSTWLTPHLSLLPFSTSKSPSLSPFKNISPSEPPPKKKKKEKKKKRKQEKNKSPQSFSL